MVLSSIHAIDLQAISIRINRYEETDNPRISSDVYAESVRSLSRRREEGVNRTIVRIVTSARNFVQTRPSTLRVLHDHSSRYAQPDLNRHAETCK